jgi:hypothetical protein
MITPDVQRLETERLRPTPRDPDRIEDMLRRLLDLIVAECRRAGYLPAAYRIAAAARGIRVPAPGEPVPDPVGADRPPGDLRGGGT